MITEAMVIKGLAYVGAYTIANKAIVPAVGFVGNKIGMGVGALANKLSKGGRKTRKETAEADEMKAQAIMALLAECDQALSENETKEEPVNTLVVVEEVKPEPMFDQGTMDWIQKCKDQYGGFANIII